MDDMYFFSNRELQAYLKTLLKFKHQGLNGITYHDNKIVVKYVLGEYSGDFKKLLQFKDEEIIDFYFVKAGIYLYLRPKIRCTISNYTNGQMLFRNAISYINIDKLIRACYRLESSVYDLSCAGIRVGDANSGNILFDTCRFKFIDTTEYFYSFDKLSKIYRENMRDIMNVIFSGILGNYILPSFRCMLKNGYYMHPAEALSTYRDELKRKGIEFNTFGDANRILMNRRYL